MKLVITEENTVANITEENTTVITVFPTNLPEGIPLDIITEAGQIIMGLEPGVATVLPAPTESGQVLITDMGEILKHRYGIPVTETDQVMVNKSGVDVEAGTVVVFNADPSNDNSFTTTTKRFDPLAFGVTMEAIANDAAGTIRVSGPAMVKVIGGVPTGCWLFTGGTAGEATATSSLDLNKPWPVGGFAITLADVAVPGTVLAFVVGFSGSCPPLNNLLVNGGFRLAQRQLPGTLTTIANDKYSADRWRISRENADLQYQRNDASGESVITSLYYGRFKKITNAGKFMVYQILEGLETVPLRDQWMTFRVALKANSARNMKIGFVDLTSSGTMDTIPATFVSAWGASAVNPTLGANLEILNSNICAVTTAWQYFSISVDMSPTMKNLGVAIWSDSQFSANDTLDVAEAGLYNMAGANPQWIEPSDTIERCRRYFWKTFSIDVAPAQNAGVASAYRFAAGKAGAGSLFSSFPYPVKMRATPTVTFYNPSATNAQVRNTSGGTDCTATATGSNASAEMCSVFCTGNAGGAVGDAHDIHMTAEIEL